MESSGWELCKENIQPLSSGRNISLLQHSLDTSKSLADHEADIEHQVRLALKLIKQNLCQLSII